MAALRSLFFTFLFHRVITMTLEQLLDQLQKTPSSTNFSDVQDVINQRYHYHAGNFTNGNVENISGTNEGSCKIFAFGQLHNLNQEQTLACFGHYYREHVLENPEGDDHQNIRQFMQHGWAGVSFTHSPLTPIKEH